MEDEKEKATILVVDDDRSVREVVHAALKKAGYSVATASNGKEALELTTRRPFDMMFLDIKMPGFDGKDILTLMGISRPEMPVVMLTAVISPEVEEEAYERGAAAYLKKPCKLQEIVDTARNVLERKAKGEFGIHSADEEQAETSETPAEEKQDSSAESPVDSEVLGI